MDSDLWPSRPNRRWRPVFGGYACKRGCRNPTFSPSCARPRVDSSAGPTSFTRPRGSSSSTTEPITVKDSSRTTVVRTCSSTPASASCVSRQRTCITGPRLLPLRSATLLLQLHAMQPPPPTPPARRGILDDFKGLAWWQTLLVLAPLSTLSIAGLIPSPIAAPMPPGSLPSAPAAMPAPPEVAPLICLGDVPHV